MFSRYLVVRKAVSDAARSAAFSLHSVSTLQKESSSRQFQLAPKVNLIAQRCDFHSTISPQKGKKEAPPSLSAVLAQQLAEEDVEVEYDQELADAQKMILQKFKLSDDVGVAMVRLTRQYNDETIEVKFDCQNEEEDILENDPEDFEEEVEEEVDESAVTGINFEVVISRGDQRLEIECFAAQNFEIRNVQHVSGELKETDDLHLYSGPKFHDLDEELQTAFYNYLAERGVDDDLNFFVQTYSQDKEQKEYTHWLRKCLDFTAK